MITDLYMLDCLFFLIYYGFIFLKIYADTLKPNYNCYQPKSIVPIVAFVLNTQLPHIRPI